MLRQAFIIAVVASVPGIAAAGNISFAAKPTAVRDGANVKITFALAEATDVEVAIVSADGRIVRRLAAGILGQNAPAPLQAGLRQELVWDGKDDAGAAVDLSKGQYTVRVSAGLSARGDGTAFGPEADKPGRLTNVIGLASGPDGRVYVLSEPWTRAWWRSTAVYVFKPSGEYDRTIKPFPGDTPAEKLAGITRLKDETGRPVPVVYRVLAMSFYPHEDAAQHFAVGPDGNLHLLNIRAAYWRDREGEKWLASLAGDGSLAFDAYAGEIIKGQTGPNDVYIAASSDGKSVFVTGMDAGPRAEPRPNAPAVYRIQLPDRKEAKPFFGDPSKPGDQASQLGDPRGLASNGKGQLFVADRANNRVLVLNENDGTRVAAIEVKSPTWLAASKTRQNTIYVLSSDDIVKFAPQPNTVPGFALVEHGRVRLPQLAGPDAARVNRSYALSESPDGSVSLWVGANRVPHVLLRCEERDGKFGDWQPAGYQPARTYWNIAAGHDGRTVGCKVGGRTLRLLDEDTGKTRDLNNLSGSPGQTYRLGPNNQIYGQDHATGLLRWDSNGKPMPFAHGPRLPNRPSGTTSWERDFDIDRAGNIYVKHRGPAYHGRKRVDKYDPEGNLLGTVIWVLSDGAYGPRVDAAGNIYIADIVKPVGEPVPQFFAGRLPDAPIDRRADVTMQYTWMYGSVLKFGPAGGAIWFPRNADNDAYAFDGEAKLPADLPKKKVEVAITGGGGQAFVQPAEVQGAKWLRYGCSYVLDMHPGHNRRCHCTATEIDVDAYGRVVYTDQGRFRVVMLDSAGNQILTIGQYGNQDSPTTGPGGQVGFNWFTGLGISDRYVYVADGANHRAVRVALEYAVRESCLIK